MKSYLICFLVLLLFCRNGISQNTVPDYSQLANWASSPYKEDNADKVPVYLNDALKKKPADVFFIHPTSYFAEEDTASWNARLDDPVVNEDTDSKSILYQTTVFNGSCRIFAPRYRQADMEAFYHMETDRAQKAFELAYQDVRCAFLYYMEHENNGRPLIIASHSQGTLHAIRLLQEFFDGTPLQQQLVCAYVPGYQIKKDAFKHLLPGTKPDQTGCFVGWRSYEKGTIPDRVLRENGNSICVNPISWTITDEWASKALHKGIMNGFDSIVPHTVAAEIEPQTKILWVESPDVIIEGMKKGKDLHIYDFNLFWMNIRENIKLRIDSYLKNHSK